MDFCKLSCASTSKLGEPPIWRKDVDHNGERLRQGELSEKERNQAILAPSLRSCRSADFTADIRSRTNWRGGFALYPRPCWGGGNSPAARFSHAHAPCWQSRSQTAPPLDAPISCLQPPKRPARANPCCTACPSYPPDLVAKMESALASLPALDAGSNPILKRAEARRRGGLFQSGS